MDEAKITKEEMLKMLDPQFMDMEYEQWYLVMEPDCKIFDEMPGSEDGTHPTWIGGRAATFVDPEWLFSDELREMIEEEE